MRIDVFENGITAWKEAIATLEKIVDGDVSFINYRMFIVNFQGALELMFKKMLFDKNEFMIFSFDKFKDNVLNRYRNAVKDNKSIFEYAISKGNGKIPDTVKFYESYQRLAYLYNMKCFTDEVIANLDKLGDLRNSIMHFEVNVDEEILTSLSKLLLICDEIFQDSIDGYGWGSDYISGTLRNKLKQKDLNMDKLIIESKFNKKIIDTIKSNFNSYIDIDINDYNLLSDIYLSINNAEKHSKEDIARRFEILVRHGFIEQNSCSYSYGNDDIDSILVIQVSDKIENNCIKKM
ncbi:hypothetical protein [Clostridium tagluense]|uniref:Uncharacterized protein n=1 Tax=Clostridium tagluense TaxID=360422 RepID=A0A401UTY2_9CLOT|nr:hypothetical protein [Clostridium tagluense]GCD13003.1 hypothetical protein Ctaglu_46260 [Clostridium tagluense]